MGSVELCDVGPRDGLQSLDVVLPPETRAGLAGRLASCGLQRVEVASFVRDDVVPAMAGAEDVVAALPPARPHLGPDPAAQAAWVATPPPVCSIAGR